MINFEPIVCPCCHNKTLFYTDYVWGCTKCGFEEEG